MPSDHNPNTYAPPYSLENLRAKLKHFSTMNHFKKRALRAIAHELLSVEEIRNMQIRFHFMDTTRRGRINLDELRIGMHELEDHIPEAGVDMIMEATKLCTRSDYSQELDWNLARVSLELDTQNPEINPYSSLSLTLLCSVVMK
ncbi:hypothetical protein G4B88_020793 [Cannabis sativa]|uniref:EF-hand domain-containing protein n=1 Tax=Cannabis sativa TaxID=3483 RepID=A0A7J6HLM1_CANSA|nr:hypothetical protein G4B88_020793 [Cannabis sativa]